LRLAGHAAPTRSDSGHAIAREVFWGPMAFAAIGDLAVATALTLVLPALYVS
jgi:multidrug efflux pump subunit AcrB